MDVHFSELMSDPVATLRAAYARMGRDFTVIAHTNPGVGNWLDTEGRPFGIVYWRFMLPEGDTETPQAEVIPLSELQSQL